uniref:Tachykinin-related peptide 5 n=1 Tax=Rhodnius prolixus TaxID=13249 RepID=TRP5_RHOPR|nr:RecName: Full=Tachykinin-related peptide 5; Short=Rhopr-TRP-5 [Rhodnius prolixus]
APACVGFQGMR